MGTMRGTAAFEDGEVRHFLYQNTSDAIISDLFTDDEPPRPSSPSSPLFEQPLLVDFHVAYGGDGGLQWRGWVSRDRRRVLTNRSWVDDDDWFDSWYLSDDGVAHWVVEPCGFGFPQDGHPDAACGHGGALRRVPASQAERRVCLPCFNRALNLSTDD